MRLIKCFTAFLIVLLVASFFASFSFFAVLVHASSTVTLYPNAAGTYQQFTEFQPNSITNVGVYGTATTTGSSFNVTMNTTLTNGDFLVLCIGDISSSGVSYISSISQTGVTWSGGGLGKQVGIRSGTNNDYDSEIWLGLVGSGAAINITLTLTGNANYGAIANAIEYSGLASSSCFDVSATYAGTTTAATNTNQTVTTAQANELWVGTAVAFSGTTGKVGQSSPLNSFTLFNGTQTTFGTNYASSSFLERIVSSTGVAYSNTTLAGSCMWDACIATFKASSLTHYQATSDSLDTTGVQVTADTTSKETENLPSSGLATGTITEIDAYFRAQCNAANQAAENYVIVGGFTSTSSHTITTSWANYYAAFPTYPDGSSWTWAEVNSGIQIGAEATTLGAGDTIQFSEFYIVVTYSTAPTAPTFALSSPSYNNTLASAATMFSCEWTNGTNPISMVLYSTNATGAWSWNNTATLTMIDTSNFWANFTATLTSTVGAVVDYSWIASDTSGNWNTSMTNQTLTTTYTDTVPPTYSSTSTSTTVAGAPCSFNCLWSDNVNVSGYIFGTNDTGTFTNNTWTNAWSNWPTATSAWANVTATLNSTVGAMVQFEWWCNDTSNNWSSSDQYNLTVTLYTPNLQITPDNITCREYLEVFSIQINVTNAEDTQGFTFTLYYDASVLNFSSVTWGELGTGTLTTIDTTNGVIGGNVAGSAVSGNHWLLNITFQAGQGLIWVEGAANKLQGNIWFNQAELDFADNSSLQYAQGGTNQIDVNQANYTFLPIQGDVNNDGTVNILDLRTIASYYGTTAADPDWTTASKYDLRPDNIIDLYDLVLVARNIGFTYP